VLFSYNIENKLLQNNSLWNVTPRLLDRCWDSGWTCCLHLDTEDEGSRCYWYFDFIPCN